MVVEDVEAATALHVGERKFGAVGGAYDRVGEYPADYENGQPTEGDLAPVTKTPTSKTREQNDSPEGVRQASRRELLRWRCGDGRRPPNGYEVTYVIVR